VPSMSGMFSRDVSRLPSRGGAPAAAPAPVLAAPPAHGASDSERDSASSGRGFFVSRACDEKLSWIFGSSDGVVRASESADDPHLGEYEITGLLGSGGFGACCRAERAR
jgi:hypothetical protein